MTDLRMNERALTLVASCIARATELRVAVQTLENGARIVDAGIGFPGGLGAGRALAEMCMGGLGHVAFTSLTIDGDTWTLRASLRWDPVLCGRKLASKENCSEGLVTLKMLRAAC
jgi:methenyltetrahydromethanopterin cyclohydrolase